MELGDTGLLFNGQDLKLQRDYFEEFATLYGLKVVYRAPLPGKQYTGYGELNDYTGTPVVQFCVFDEYPTQRTMRKLGWNAERMDAMPILHVPYDLPGVQRGGIFIIPSGIDHAEGRIFKILDMSNISIYPASIACQIGPVMKSNFEPALKDHKNNNFSVLKDIDSDPED